MSDRLSLTELLEPERLSGMGDAQIIHVLARLWADPELRAILSGSGGFVRERLEHYGRRGYLTSAERQGIFRSLYTSAVPMYDRLRAWEAGRFAD
jgi:hypothetical protein